MKYAEGVNGLTLELVDPSTQGKDPEPLKLPKKIRIESYKQLKRLAWQLKHTKDLTPEEALNLYERNWKHVNFSGMEPQEKKLLEMLLRSFGREGLFV